MLPPTNPPPHNPPPLDTTPAPTDPGTTSPPAAGIPTNQRLIEFDQFTAVDMRVGRVIEVEGFPRPQAGLEAGHRLRTELGVKRSSAQITHYSREELQDTLVVAVVNFPPRQIGPVSSEVLVLGVLNQQRGVVLAAARLVLSRAAASADGGGRSAAVDGHQTRRSKRPR